MILPMAFDKCSVASRTSVFSRYECVADRAIFPTKIPQLGSIIN